MKRLTNALILTALALIVLIVAVGCTPNAPPQPVPATPTPRPPAMTATPAATAVPTVTPTPAPTPRPDPATCPKVAFRRLCRLPCDPTLHPTEYRHDQWSNTLPALCPWWASYTDNELAQQTPDHNDATVNYASFGFKINPVTGGPVAPTTSAPFTALFAFYGLRYSHSTACYFSVKPGGGDDLCLLKGTVVDGFLVRDGYPFALRTGVNMARDYWTAGGK